MNYEGIQNRYSPLASPLSSPFTFGRAFGRTSAGERCIPPMRVGERARGGSTEKKREKAHDAARHERAPEPGQGV